VESAYDSFRSDDNGSPEAYPNRESPIHSDTIHAANHDRTGSIKIPIATTRGIAGAHFY